MLHSPRVSRPGISSPGRGLPARLPRIAALASIFISLSSPAWAMLQFSPMEATIQPSSGQNVQVFTITNAGKKDIAVRVRITTRSIDEAGQESRAEATGLFSIYPSQAILKPGEERSVRVTWKGGTSISTEQAFRIIAEQLPVDMRTGGEVGYSAAIKIQFRYEGALYVAPRSSAPRVKASLRAIPDGGAELVLQNEGNKHIVILEPSLVLRGADGFEHAVSAAELEPIRGRNILAGSTRVLPLALPPEVVAGIEALTADFSYKKD